MNEAQAINILVEIAKLAQSKGILSLDTAVYAYNAIKVVQSKNEQAKETGSTDEGGKVLSSEKKGTKQNGK